MAVKKDETATQFYRVHYTHPEHHEPGTRSADGEYARVSLTKEEAAKLSEFFTQVQDNLGRHQYISISEWAPCPAYLQDIIACPNEFGKGHAGPHMVWND